MSDRRAVKFDERGMVSFLVTLIMMLVITLIVIGFSEVTRRNAREALDRQLSSQAFYAAESGINVTQQAIATYITTTGLTNLVAKTACANDYSATIASGVVGGIAPLSGANNVRYTCVLVNPSPSNLQFPVSQRDSVVMPITADANVKTMTFTWAAQGLNAASKLTCAGATDTGFTPSDVWASDCDLGVLRLDLIQNPGTAATNATNLDTNTISLFLTPRGTHTGTKTVTFGPTTAYVVSGYDATTGSGKCTSGVCKAVITLPINTASYQFRATMLYKESDTVSISGTNASNTAVKFSGAQAVVDVTGQDQDELRRIQARISLTNSGTMIPANAVASSGDICKNFSIMPGASVDLSTVDDCH